MSEKPGISGYCDARFLRLRELFAGLLADGRETGAAVTLYVEGRKVLDLWGGWADSGRALPWQHDTLVSTFSVSKALVATMGHMLVDRGILDLDRPVAHYWPAFGQNGKEGILVRHLLDHTCALSYVDRPLGPGELYNWETMIQAVEESAPNGPYGRAPVYLNMTFGYLMGGLVYKLTGKRIGQFNRDHLCGPLGLDYHFALRSQELPRVATVYQAGSPRALFDEIARHPDTIFARTMQGFAADEDFNSAGWRSSEVGSGQGHGNARAIAGLFEMLRAGGVFNGTHVLRRDTRDRAIAFQCASDGLDPILGVPIRFALGYEINCPPFPMGPNPAAFGHWGAGGSFGFADIDAGVAFGYTPNFMHPKLELGPRGSALVQAVFDCL